MAQRVNRSGFADARCQRLVLRGDVVLIAFFGVMAWRISTAIRRESHIFAEFNQPRSLAFLVLLFPLGPLVLFFAALLPLLAWPLAAACFVPALVVSRQRIYVFERAGTDRVRAARTASSHAFGTSILGLSYIAIHVVLTLTFAGYAASA